MAFAEGWAAIHMEKPAYVPRTEYSAEGHWPLVSRVTGIQVDETSPRELRAQASRAFRRAWDYCFAWNVLIGGGIFEGCRTSMGHAVYAAGGVDYDTRIYCPFDDPEQVFAFDPMEQYGVKNIGELTENFNRHYRASCEAMPDEVNMTGIYVTCVSGLIEIFGWEMLLVAAGTDPARFGEVTNRYARFIQQYFDALAQSEAPVVMIHDDIVWTSGAIFHPDWYRKYVFSNYKKFFQPLLDAGKRILYTSDGTYTEFVDDIAACGVHGFVMEPTTDMAYIAEKYGKTHVIVGNADTRILLSGSREAIYDEVKRCMDIGKDCPGFIMAVGNHIPSNTPVENCLYYDEVYRKLRNR